MKRLIAFLALGFSSILQAEPITIEAETLQDLQQELSSIKFSVQALQGQQVTNYLYNQSEFERIRFLLGDRFEAKTQAEPVEKIAPQYMMAPNVRHLTDNEKIEAELLKMRNAGLNGLHIPWSTDWFSFKAGNYKDLSHFSFNENCFEMLENIRRHCERDGVYLHVWIFGDEQNEGSLSSVLGKRSDVEKALLKKINDTFGGKPYITFGLGFDLEEWVSLDYAKWIKAQLPDVKISMRHPDGIFNEIADIPSMMHRRFQTADLEAFAAKYPHAEIIISEDRCRNHDWDWQDDSYASIFSTGHFTREEQQRVYDDCVRLGISCIFGRLTEKQARYQYGSKQMQKFN